MQYINDSMGASLVFVLMVPVVPTGTLPDGHTGSHLKIVGPELQWWVPLAHSGSYWGGDPLRL